MNLTTLMEDMLIMNFKNLRHHKSVGSSLVSILLVIGDVAARVWSGAWAHGKCTRGRLCMFELPAESRPMRLI